MLAALVRHFFLSSQAPLWECVEQQDSAAALDQVHQMFFLGPDGPSQKFWHCVQRFFLKKQHPRLVDGLTALAIDQHNLALLQALLPFGRTRVLWDHQVCRWSKPYHTPLLWAIEKGFVEGVALLASNDDLLFYDDENPHRSALIGAAGHSESKVLAYLLSLTPLVEPMVTSAGQFALFRAAERGHVENLKLLLKVVQPVDQDALNTAASQGYLECFDVLMPTIGTAMQGEMFKTLCVCAQYGFLHGVKRLFALIDIQARDTHEQTPLMIAAKHGNTEVVQFLLQAVSDPTLEARNVNRDGDTALNLAAGSFESSFKTIGVLVPLSDTSVRNAAGLTAFGCAWQARIENRRDGLSDGDLWQRLDLLAFHELDAALVATAYKQGGRKKMPQWAAHLEGLTLRASSPSTLAELVPAPSRKRL